MGTRAQNYTSRVNKWKPYLNKPFYLGSVNNADGEDGGKYIIDESLRLSGGSFSDTNMKAYCDDESNSSNAYLIQIHKTSNETRFLVRKFDTSGAAASDVDGEDIWASSDSGDGRYWYIGDPGASGTSVLGRWITIDVGVYIQLWGDPNSYSTSDRYILRMPDCKGGVKWTAGSEEGIQSMRKRRLYFGGFHSYLQLPTSEGDAFHRDIIPSSLKGKGVTCIFGKQFSVSFEWSADKDAANSHNAGSVTYNWGLGEKWPSGNLMVNDVDPSDILNPTLRTMVVNVPKIDNSGGLFTGTVQTFNVSTFSKGGHAKIRTEFFTGVGSTNIQSHNQYWPCTLMIN